MALMTSSQRSLLVRLSFASWRMIVQATPAAALRTENERLSQLMGKQKDSIWVMNKEGLIEVAIRELGLTRVQAGKETVVTLRERIRRARAQNTADADPLKKIPPGLDRMKVDQLTAECTKRLLSTATLKTRPQMILAIREDVANRLQATPEDMEVDKEGRKTEWLDVGTPERPPRRARG